MFWQLALLVGAGLLGPILAGGRRPLAPVLVGELIAGAVVGKTGWHLLDPTLQPFPIFFSLGFAMLMLGAGTEVDLASADVRRGILRGSVALIATLVAGIPLALILSGTLHLGNWPLLAVLLAGSSAAVAFPIVEERGLAGPGIALLIGWITLADAVTALLMPLTISGPARIPGALAGDLAIVGLGAVVMAVGSQLSGRPSV
ncbi:MAG TPA: cation:proton antiporter, partial [Candidatus Dormibacteraeota bacterium]|nr:cation:proton antiporter [Candidatus Dormibacteraeota bacterium]